MTMSAVAADELPYIDAHSIEVQAPAGRVAGAVMLWVVGQLQSSSAAISLSVHAWSAMPAAIAGVRGYGFARLLCGRAKL
jgi:hypothetical protein